MAVRPFLRGRVRAGVVAVALVLGGLVPAGVSRAAQPADPATTTADTAAPADTTVPPAGAPTATDAAAPEAAESPAGEAAPTAVAVPPTTGLQPVDGPAIVVPAPLLPVAPGDDGDLVTNLQRRLTELGFWA